MSGTTDRVLDELNDWQNRPLKKVYAFVIVDCMYVTIRRDYEVKETAVYTILGYDLQGKKDILGLRLNETESKNVWMQIFDEIKSVAWKKYLYIYGRSKRAYRRCKIHISERNRSTLYRTFNTQFR